jgi:hypothetical protein
VLGQAGGWKLVLPLWITYWRSFFITCIISPWRLERTSNKKEVFCRIDRNALILYTPQAFLAGFFCTCISTHNIFKPSASQKHQNLRSRRISLLLRSFAPAMYRYVHFGRKPRLRLELHPTA